MEHSSTGEVSPQAGVAPAPEPTPAAPKLQAPSFSEIIKAGWSKFKDMPGKLFLSGAVSAIAAFLAMTLLDTAGRMVGKDVAIVRAIFALLSQIAFLWLMVGMGALYLHHVRTGVIDYKHLYNAPNHQQAFLAQLVTQLIATAGLILLIVPGIIWGLRYMFTSILVLDRGMPIKEAMELSARMAYGYRGRLFLYNIGIGLVLLLGVIALLLGVFVAIPVVMIAWIYLYEKMAVIANTRTDTVVVGNTNTIYLYGIIVGGILMVLGSFGPDPDHKRLEPLPTDGMAVGMDY